jgi:hypothetical protein
MGSRQEFLTRVKDMADVRLDFVEHELVCPLCQKRTRHASAGATIPLASARCEHCGNEFLIVQSKPWPVDDGTDGQAG